MPGWAAWVGFTGIEEHGGIGDALLDELVWREGGEAGYFLRIVDIREFFEHCRSAVTFPTGAEEIEYRNAWNDGTPQIRTLSHRHAGHQAAVRVTGDGEPVGARPAARNQVLSDRIEVVIGVLLVRHAAPLPPV